MAEAENGKRQMHARTLESQGSSPSARVRLGISGIANASTGTSAGQGVGGSSWQPLTGPTPGQRWQSNTPPTPLKPEVPTPSRTSNTARATQVTQASPVPLRPNMGPVITPVRQTPNAPGSASTGGSSQKPLCVPLLFHVALCSQGDGRHFVTDWVGHGRCRPCNRSRRRRCPVRQRHFRSRRYRGCKSCRGRHLYQRTSDRCVISRKRREHASKRPIS